MKIDSTQLLGAYEATRIFAHEDSAITELFIPVEEMFEDKKTKQDAVIMVYGVYNAGKSTLINTLLGREEAATDDVPTTDTITAYKWGQYSILDTPGVDAPIMHENVTNAQMIKADGIVFVVNPVGTAEEVKTLTVLLDLLQAGKQVFLVFNEKKSIGEEDFIKLKDQTRERLQQMASARGMHNILKDIPIVKINAKRALQGYVKEQPKMVELSGYPYFEKQLREFLQSISPDDIYGRLKNNLVNFLTTYIEVLSNRSVSDVVKKYDKLLLSISTEKSTLRQHMSRELSRQRLNINEKSKLFMRSYPESSRDKIVKLLESAGKDVGYHLSNELQILINRVHEEIDGLRSSLPPIFENDFQAVVPYLETAGSASDFQRGAVDISNIGPDLIKGSADQIALLATPEHIVNALRAIKDVLPSLMKGVGIKTMEKWALLATTKWIPYVGLVISAGQAIYSIFSTDSGEEKLRQQQREQQDVRERAMQQVEDFSREISDGFETSMRDIIEKELDSFFSDLTAQVDRLRNGFSNTEEKNSLQLENLIEIRQVALSS